jgi:hypothetical protein
MPNRDYFIPPRRGLGVTFFVLDLVQERNGGHEVPLGRFVRQRRSVTLSRRQKGEEMSERDGYELGVPVPEARTQTRRLPCLVTAAPPDPGGAASTMSQLVIASQGA